MRHPERRLLISVDMARYSRRSNLQQYEAQQDFQRLLHDAARAVGIDRATWLTQQAGDGELAVLPQDVPESRVIGRFVPELNRLLRQYNVSRVPAARVRLRVAVYQGPVHLDGANGFPGSAAIGVSRLCDAPQLKHALASFPEAGVALIVSDDIYRDVVNENPEENRPERFRQSEVSDQEKGFREFAWLCVLDEDMSLWRDPGNRREGDAGPDPASADGTTSDASVPATRNADVIRTGDIRVDGQNAIGAGAVAIGSISGDAHLDGNRDKR